MKVQISFLALALTLVFLGCATQRTSLPEIDESPRTNLSLQEPVLFSVLDARSNKENSKKFVRTLRTGLEETYPGSTVWFDYFSNIPDGKVAVRIRLKANEANFGSRIISNSTIQNTFTNTQANISDGWNSVLVTASSQQSTLSTNFSTEGWWIGTSWLELEIIDKRSSNVQNFSFPIVAEHKESNTWGYKSANKAVNESWSSVSQQLIQVFDKILLTVRNQERTANKAH